MGIDPGLNITGVGIVQKLGREVKFVHGEVIRSSKQGSVQHKLLNIYQRVLALIDEYNPDVCVIEEVFYSINVKTAITMGHTRGVIMLAGMMREKEIISYSPRDVKLAVVGTGSASKEQVQFMVKNILGLRELKGPMDLSDALALALCHANRN
ncbi:MAG: crossover junction endodeoxyribonuclease RuvC [Calditrichia bacterium]